MQPTGNCSLSFIILEERKKEKDGSREQEKWISNRIILYHCVEMTMMGIENILLSLPIGNKINPKSSVNIASLYSDLGRRALPEEITVVID